MLQQQNIAHIKEKEALTQDLEVSVSPVQAEAAGSYLVEDVKHLLDQYQQPELSYHEIGRRNSLNKIRQRWPLLAELDEID